MFCCEKILTAITVGVKTRTFASVASVKMAGWKEDKEKFLSMPLDAKRKFYAGKQYKQISDIPTWEEYAKKATLAPQIPSKTDFQIDSSLNSSLCKKVSIFQGDITTLEIDAIVNAANTSLLGGGGVDGAIHRAAGPNLLAECKTLNGCPTGDAVITGGYKLPAKYVIHTVGPRGEKPGLLQQCYRNCLKIMAERKLQTVAFPCISTGIYDYPNEPAAHVAASEVRKFLEKNSEVERVVFCIFLDQDHVIYEGVLQSYFPLK
nr:PREDICTED: macro domain-containing protein CT2219 [Tribolium castaneum]|eukprot:XP_001812598.3 PREDICTED: macro domain-containing protein CT2219 [Tribolium castaneum]